MRHIFSRTRITVNFFLLFFGEHIKMHCGKNALLQPLWPCFIEWQDYAYNHLMVWARKIFKSLFCSRSKQCLHESLFLFFRKTKDRVSALLLSLSSRIKSLVQGIDHEGIKRDEVRTSKRLTAPQKTHVNVTNCHICINLVHRVSVFTVTTCTSFSSVGQSCSATAGGEGTRDWWYVNLGASYNVQYVRITTNEHQIYPVQIGVIICRLS